MFGAYLTEPWILRHDQKGYFGTGESFVFELAPEEKMYEWVGAVRLRERREKLAKVCVSLQLCGGGAGEVPSRPIESCLSVWLSEGDSTRARTRAL